MANIKTSSLKYHFYLDCLKIIGFDNVHSCNACHDIIVAYVMTKIFHWEIQEAHGSLRGSSLF